MKVCSRLAAFFACVSLFAGSATASKVIHVPADQPTIQAGISAASNGDTVLVAPGTYNENINFNGKAITVESSSGPSVTVIANKTAETTGATFDDGEGPTSVLQGFTMTGAVGTTGIFISSSPTILDNTISGNHECDGAGIFVSSGSPIIEGNTISDNFHDQCSGGVGGGGIAIEGQGSAQVIGNVISGNNGGNGFAGGGISLWAAGTPLIMNNIVRNNIGFQGGGLGISACCENPIIVQNIFIGNSAGTGGAIYSFPNSGAPVFVNNSFVYNTSGNDSSAVYTNSSIDEPTLLYNNIIVAMSGQIALVCGDFNTTTLPVIISNDVFAPEGTPYGGCTDQTGINGNISADPQFISSTNRHVKGGSATIDAGDNAAPDLPATDLAGNPRILNGNGGSTAVVDMGVYEFVPVTLTAMTLSFGAHAVGTANTKTVTLTNAQAKPLNIFSKSVPVGYEVSGCPKGALAAFSSCTMTVKFFPLTAGSFTGKVTIKDDAGNSPQTFSLSGSAD
jgi:hypothetical protein